jgi:hypothetical protein
MTHGRPRNADDLPPPEYRDADRLRRIFRAIVDIEDFSERDVLTDPDLGELAAAAARLCDACVAELRGRLYRFQTRRRA